MARIDKGRRGKAMKRKKRPGLLLPLVLVLAGLGLILYPLVSDALYNTHVQAMKLQFQQQLSQEGEMQPGETEDEEEEEEELPYQELYEELVRRNRQLFLDKQADLVDPFSYERQDVDLTDYGLEGNVIGFLSIPRMEVELPILLGANNENMTKGAVHLTQTSYPVGGENTNCVIAAHRGYSKTAMFRDIELLELGDRIYIQNFRETLTYEVVELRVILPTDVDQLLIQEGRDLVSLLTCHPYGHNYQRYVVFCERVEEEEGSVSAG